MKKRLLAEIKNVCVCVCVCACVCELRCLVIFIAVDIGNKVTLYHLSPWTP